MNKKSSLFVGFLPVLLCTMLFGACSMGLNPAWKAKDTTVSLTLGSSGAMAASSSSRAIINGSGCLYLRADGIVYGPYQAESGKKITTSDIPAGSYKLMMVVLSDSDLDALALAKLDSGEKLYTLNSGAISWSELKNVQILPESENSLDVTLVPSVSPDLTVDFSNEKYALENYGMMLITPKPGETTVRRFIRVDHCLSGLSTSMKVTSVNLYSIAVPSYVTRESLYGDVSVDISEEIPGDFSTSLEIDTKCPSTVLIYSGDGKSLKPVDSKTDAYMPELTMYPLADPDDGTYYIYYEYTTQKSNGMLCGLALFTEESLSTATVDFETGAGTFVNSQTVSLGSPAVKPVDPTQSGYIFAGWYVDEACTVAWDFAIPIGGDITLFAKWIPDGTPTAIVTFNSMGGSPVDSQTVAIGQPISMFIPSQPGYSFVGWYTSDDYTTPWTPDAKVTADMTLYAKWTIESYTVSFDSMGGSPVDSQTVDYGSTSIRPADPTLSGYVFAGWYFDEGYVTTWSFSDPVYFNATLYAKWIPEGTPTAIVTFDSMGGSSVDPQTVAVGGTLSSPVPSQLGFIFDKWYTSSDYATPWYFGDTVTASMTLYAKWNIATYTVSFDTGSGTSVASQTVNYSTTATQPVSPTQSGYTFGGWFSDEACTLSWSFMTPVTENKTLYAKWVPVPYTVSFTTGSGTAIASQTVNYGSTATQPAAPTWAGYTFGGWYTDVDCTSSWSFATTITSDRLLYAKWVPEGTPPGTETVTVSLNNPESPVVTVAGGTSVSLNKNTAETMTVYLTTAGCTDFQWLLDGATGSAALTVSGDTTSATISSTSLSAGSHTMGLFFNDSTGAPQSVSVLFSFTVVYE